MHLTCALTYNIKTKDLLFTDYCEIEKNKGNLLNILYLCALISRLFC